ncbi:UNVERIFIED_CONTAM: hypothetical protein HDU68_004348 [Siphonaria sp. JEL0065]|nr:hypothetical protein HDU68_004348 [Siphonaria sp. JEL0065]
MIFQPVPSIVMKHGTKPAAVADFLRKTLAASPDNRIIVFSKWHSMLNLLAKTLNTLKIPNLFPKMALNEQVALEAYASTHPSTTPSNKKKKNAEPTPSRDEYATATSRIEDPINEFKTSSEFRVLMLSLQESASGTNLQCANVIVLLEPASGDGSAHAIATEQQAIGRAVRYGQTNLVSVYKFIVKGTIEEDLYRFQETERKKRLQLTEGNVVHLRRARLLESNAAYTRHNIQVSEPRIVEEEKEEEAVAEVEEVEEDEGKPFEIESHSEGTTSQEKKQEAPSPVVVEPETPRSRVQNPFSAAPRGFGRPAKIARKMIEFCCPICCKNLEVNTNADVNVHVDECLIKSMNIQ